MTAYGIFLCTLSAVAATGVAWYAGSVARQITYVTLADGRRQQRAIPLLFRMLLPLAGNMRRVTRHSSLDKPREQADKRLVAAGFEGLLRGDEYLALQFIVPVILAPFWVFLVWGAVSTSVGSFLERVDMPIHVAGVVLCILYPHAWLKGAMTRRHKSIRRAIPFVLDLLTLSVEAGMDFMSAIQRNIERRVLDPLGEEFIRVVREIQLGKTRREALRDMATRVNLGDLRQVVNALAQADELGVSIGSILRIQADQMRQRRFDRAEKLANEAPIKMLFPLMVCIFPSVFLVLLGPILTRLYSQLF